MVQDFHLEFRVPQYVEPIAASSVARTVHVRPEVTTIVYAHQSFTVRQHVLAPLDEAAVLVLLDVDTTVPLEVNVAFRSVMQYAWPGGLGGQYASWDGGRKAFLLSESRRQHNVFVGSPWATSASSQPAHSLPDAPSVFTIRVDAERTRREFIPIAIVGGIEPRDAVAARYAAVFGRARAMYDARVAHADALRTGATSISTPSREVDRAFEWAKVNLDEQLVCNPDLGCGLVAGWGPSGKSARPGFGWFFGGDAAINSLAMSSAGMGDLVAQGLRFLARYQRDDGKIPHEVSQAAGRIAWFTDFPYAYYHADTTPFWIVAVWQYVRATGDTALLKELWPKRPEERSPGARSTTATATASSRTPPRASARLRWATSAGTSTRTSTSRACGCRHSPRWRNWAPWRRTRTPVARPRPGTRRPPCRSIPSTGSKPPGTTPSAS